MEGEGCRFKTVAFFWCFWVINTAAWTGNQHYPAGLFLIHASLSGTTGTVLHILVIGHV
ncbi:hypothetical protein CBFG_02029 [Clostridiales bacterium 1_7_47FAA]|nr:hypothetical protein CBFG_02029 [Clostridiales bacterium 1_7_47FAA]